jgi:hypothetical protein
MDTEEGGAEMNASDIERYLLSVGEELQAMNVNEPIRLLLVGGGYMLTQIHNRTTTGDIDTVWLYPEIHSGSEIYRLFKAAVRFVADDEGLNTEWLNINVGGFVRAAGPLPKMKLWKKFAVVHVYLPPQDFILALKLTAAREKDQDDIEALCRLLGIDTRKKAQRVLDKYIKQEIQADNHVASKLDAFFAQ